MMRASCGPRHLPAMPFWANRTRRQNLGLRAVATCAHQAPTRAGPGYRMGEQVAGYLALVRASRAWRSVRVGARQPHT
jgi:hypothetical protein